VKRLLLFLLLAGCVRAQYTRTVINEPLEEDLVGWFERGDDLGLCMDQYGAPVRVWETEDGGFAIAYGWLRDRGWGFSASYSLDALAPAISFSYDDTLKRMRGIVFWFDEKAKLRQAKTGLLTDLLPPRRRPQDLDLLEELKRKAAR
jgi:hypothetical protein